MNLYNFFKFLNVTKGKPIWVVLKAFNEPETITDDEWNNIEEWDIDTILVQRPELADKIPNLSKLNHSYVANILGKQPQLIDKFDLSHMIDLDISKMISSQPQLINRFDTSNFKPAGVAVILMHQPQLINRFDVSKLDGYSILGILYYQPQLINKLDISGLKEHAKYRPNVLYGLLQQNPQLEPYFKD